MRGPKQVMITLALVALVAGGTVSAEGDNFCQGCKSIVSFVRRFNSSLERSESKDLFRSYCQLYYPASTDYQLGPCPLFVEGLFYVIDHTDAVHHCDQIGACDPGHKLATQPSDDIYEYLQASNNVIRPSRPGPVGGEDAICETCEQVVTQAKNALEDPQAIEVMKKQVESFCEYLVVVNADKECRQMLYKYINQAVDFVRRIEPAKYCRALRLCPAEPVVRSDSRKQGGAQLANLPSLADFQDFGLETSVVIGNEKSTSKSSSGCMLCKTVIKELFHIIRENKTEEAIMDGLKKVCSIIYSPGEKREQCDSMVKAYTRELVQLMIDETDPEMICMLLDMCLYSRTSLPFKTLLPTATDGLRRGADFSLADLISALDGNVGYKSGEACLECKLFVEYLRKQLDQVKTLEEAKKWLKENLCAGLAQNDLVEMCTSVVEKDMPILFQAIKSVLQPKAACHELGVCAAKSPYIVFSLENSPLMPLIHPVQRASLASEQNKKSPTKLQEISGGICDQCVEIVSEIDDYLSSHPVDQDVSVIIDKVCNKMPEGSVRDECTYIIKAFGAEIVQAISTMDNPRQLCSKIYLCSANQA